MELSQHGSLGTNGITLLKLSGVVFGLPVYDDIAALNAKLQAFLAEIEFFLDTFVGGVIKYELGGGCG